MSSRGLCANLLDVPRPSRATTAIDRREYVISDDSWVLANPVQRRRLALNTDAECDRVGVDELSTVFLDAVAVPEKGSRANVLLEQPADGWVGDTRWKWFGRKHLVDRLSPTPPKHQSTVDPISVYGPSSLHYGLYWAAHYPRRM